MIFIDAPVTQFHCCANGMHAESRVFEKTPQHRTRSCVCVHTQKRNNGFTFLSEIAHDKNISLRRKLYNFLLLDTRCISKVHVTVMFNFSNLIFLSRMVIFIFLLLVFLSSTYDIVGLHYVESESK
jgi:hypothetical protein